MILASCENPQEKRLLQLIDKIDASMSKVNEKQKLSYEELNEIYQETNRYEDSLNINVDENCKSNHLYKTTVTKYNNLVGKLDTLRFMKALGFMTVGYYVGGGLEDYSNAKNKIKGSRKIICDITIRNTSLNDNDISLRFDDPETGSFQRESYHLPIKDIDVLCDTFISGHFNLVASKKKQTVAFEWRKKNVYLSANGPFTTLELKLSNIEWFVNTIYSFGTLDKRK
jgi:hypothetical protein